MRPVTYYVACTADGYISREDGSFDFFPMEGPHIEDYVRTFPDTIPGHLREALGVSGENRRFDTVLMGRRTYEAGLKEGITSPYPHLRQILFSTSMREPPDPRVELVSGDAAGFVRGLKSEEGKGIWLCGGGALAAALAGEIDELILKLNPVLLGGGVPLFRGGMTAQPLELTGSKAYSNGVMLLTYRVVR